MKGIKFYSTWFLLLLFLTATTVNGQSKFRLRPLNKPFVHPGMMQNAGDLETMKREALAGVEPWKAAFDRLKSATPPDYTAHAVTHLSQGPYGAADVGGNELMKSAEIAYNAALLWYITGNKQYAAEAAGILNAWAYTLRDLDGNNAKLLAGLSGYGLLNAAEILRYSNSGWKAADIRQFKKLMLDVYYPLIRNFFPEANGNWDASMTNTMLCIAIFSDDHAMFNRAVTEYYVGTGNGGITKYIYPGGQVQESTRDWGHVQLGLGEFAKAAQVAWTQGVDFYSVGGNRLALGFEYASKYMLGGSVPVYGQISARDRNYLRDIYESIYNHYHDIKHLNMPYTLGMRKRTRPQTSQVLLVSLRRWPSAPGHFTDLPQPGTNALRTGAGDTAVTLNKPDIICIRPGIPIQPALDSCKAGGRVVLLKGVHIIDSALRLPSDISLSGEGKETILFLAPKLSGTAIVNKYADMHNVAISNMLIEGAVSVKEGFDPNNNRRLRSYYNAPARAGIVFASDAGRPMHHITLDHLTVENCTGSGVAVSGADDLIIRNCDISDNGSAAVPGKGLHHNLDCAYIKNGMISKCRLDTSPWGNGAEISSCTDITISYCEVARNKLNGIDCNEVTHLTLINNIAEGNDQNGILIGGLMHKTSGKLIANTCNNNGAKGIENKAALVTPQNNTIMDNGMAQ